MQYLLLIHHGYGVVCGLALVPRLKKDTNWFGKRIWQEMLNRPKEMNAVSTKSIAAIFPSSLPKQKICPLFFFTLSCLGMFWVHVMHILNTPGGIKGYVTYYLTCYVRLRVQNMPGCHLRKIWMEHSFHSTDLTFTPIRNP